MKILLSLHHASQVSMITAVANHNNSLMSIGFYYGSYETLPPLSNPLCVLMNERQEISSQGSYTSQPALNRRKRIHMYPCRNIKNVHRQGHKTSRRALGCPEGVGFRIMARQRMAKLIKYGHSEAISCHIMTYFRACQNFMLLTELWRVATSYPWPSDEDLA